MVSAGQWFFGGQDGQDNEDMNGLNFRRFVPIAAQFVN